jgi:hypothetical protein
MDLGVYPAPLREIMDEAIYAPVTYEQLQQLPLHTRCRLIRHMTQRLLQQHKPGVDDLSAQSLQYMGKSFEISDNYNELQENRLKRLLKKLKEKQYRPLRNTIRHWEHAADHQRQETLRETARVHQRVTMEGIADILPISHSFMRLMPRQRKTGTTVLYGTFSGDFNAGRGRIRQNIHESAGFDDALIALDTSHHEMAHGIHFSLAFAYHHGRIRPDHPLHDDAQYFHAVKVHEAGIPSILIDAYSTQTFEVLAEREGRSVAAGIYGLAL